MRLMRPTRSLLGDVALALALAAFGVVGTIGADDNIDTDVPIDARGLGLVIAAAVILVGRRRWPLTTLGIGTILINVYLFLGYPYGPIFLPFSVAVYTAARLLPLARSVPASAGAAALFVVQLFTSGEAAGLLGLLPAAAWVTVPFAIGFTVRQTRESAAQGRAEVVRQHVDDERLRVALEVHDVVGHGLAAIKMQADIALHVLHKQPEQAELALSAISRTSTDALDELRATLAVVRHPDPDAPRSPGSGLDRLDDLGQRMGEAGIRVQLEVSGKPGTLAAAIDLAAYRIVQESLTNVLRHSDARDAIVGLEYRPEALVVTVSNPAPRPAVNGAGLGIVGMRQRVTLLGGDFSAGPTVDGHFEVRACLPTEVSP